MKSCDITILPDEFKFVSVVNQLTRGEFYHAVRDLTGYTVTLGNSKWHFSEHELTNCVRKGRYVIKE